MSTSELLAGKYGSARSPRTWVAAQEKLRPLAFSDLDGDQLSLAAEVELGGCAAAHQAVFQTILVAVVKSPGLGLPELFLHRRERLTQLQLLEHLVRHAPARLPILVGIEVVGDGSRNRVGQQHGVG